MAKDIVKEILLKFKGDTKPLEKSIKDTEKVVNGLQKTVSGTGGTGSIASMNKTLEKYTKEAGKFGVTLSKDMTKFQKAIQEVATKDLRVLQTQTDTLFRKTEQRMKRLRQEEEQAERLKRETGGLTGREQRRLDRMRAVAQASQDKTLKSANDYVELAESMPGDQRPGWRNRVGRAANVVGGVAATVGTVADIAFRVREAQETSKATLSETLKQRRMAAYSGDMTEAMLQRKDKILSRADDYAKDQTKKRDWMMGAAGIAGIAGLAALTVGTGGLAAIALGGAAAVGGLGTSIPYFMGGRQGFQEQQRRQQVGRLRNQTMTDVHYQYLRERAPQRYEFQRLMQMGDTDAGFLRGHAYTNLFSEQDASNTAMNLRMFGTRVAPQLAADTMGLARRQGRSLQDMTAMAQGVAFSDVGGARNTKKTLTDIYTDSFTKGIVDSGLLEVFQKGMIEMAQKSPDVSDISAMSARIASTLDTVTGGRNVTARDIAGVMGAQGVLGNVSMQGGESGFVKMSNLADITGGNEKAMAFLANRTDEQIYQLAKNKDPRLMRFLGPEGVKNLEQEYSPAATLSRKLGTTQAGQDTIREMERRIKAGESASQITEALGGDIEIAAGEGQLSKEQSAAVVASVMDDMARRDPKMKEQIERAKAKDEVIELDNIKKLAGGSPQERAQAMQLIERRMTRDSDRPDSDTSYMNMLTPQEQALVMHRVTAGRNARTPEGIGTRAEAQMKAQSEGAYQQDVESAKGVTAADIYETATAMRSAVAPSMDLSSSVTNLKTALDAFVRSIDAQGNSASAQSSGTQ